MKPAPYVHRTLSAADILWTHVNTNTTINSFRLQRKLVVSSCGSLWAVIMKTTLTKRIQSVSSHIVYSRNMHLMQPTLAQINAMVSGYKMIVDRRPLSKKWRKRSNSSWVKIYRVAYWNNTTTLPQPNKEPNCWWSFDALRFYLFWDFILIKCILSLPFG